MEVLSRYGIRASAALNSEVCDHHPEIIKEGGKLGWEWIGHNQTNAMRLTEMDPAAERAAIRATIDRIEAASGTRPVGWLGAGSGGDLEHARLSRGSRHPLCLRLGQRRPALPVRDRYAAAGGTAVFCTDQRRSSLFRDEGVGARIRGDAEAPVRHPVSRGRNRAARHGDRDAPVRHRPATSYRRA